MKIRGNTVGTSIKPERSVLNATDLTEEQKAQVRENIGVGASVVEKQYELIEDITLDEDTSSIVRTATPDGTPYDFEKMFVCFEAPAASVTAAIAIYYRDSEGNNIAYQGINGGVNTTAKSSYSKVYNDHGLVEHYYMTGGSGATMQSYGYYYNNAWRNVSKLYLESYPSSTHFPTGTRIRIWAVRG